VPLGPLAGEEAEQVGELPRELVRTPVPQRCRGGLVGAGRPADAQVDPARVQRLEHAELLRHH
jgi:hypothetical protein